MGLPRVLASYPAERTKRALELGRRESERELEQTLLKRRRRRFRQRTNLREGEFAARERAPDQRQLLQRLRHPHVLARLSPRDPAAEREPAGEIVAGGAALLPEGQDELEPTRRRRIDMGREGCKLVLESLLQDSARASIGELRCLNSKQISDQSGRTRRDDEVSERPPTPDC